MAILNGQLPTINFFNNFGVPILGDGLTYPFAIQSITYYFFPDHIAMSINRFFIAGLTLFSAFLFCRIYLNGFISILCAVLITFNPVSFWYPVHQYQMATPFFLLSFFLLNKFYISPSQKLLWYNFILFIIMILSVSINHIILIIPFLFTWCFFRNECLFNRNYFAPLITFFSAMLFSLPQTLDFFINFFNSARIKQGVYDNILTNFNELFLGMVIPPGDWIAFNYGAQLQITTYTSIQVIVSILIGIILIRKKILWKQTTLFFSGLIPTILALFLYINPEIRLQIPLIKSVDITRVFWFSYPFCIIYTGYFFNSIWLQKIKKIPIFLSITILSLTLYFIIQSPVTKNINIFYLLTILSMITGFLLLFVSSNIEFLKNNIFKHLASKFSIFIILTSTLITVTPTIIRILGLNSGYCGGTQYSANRSLSQFDPISFIPFIKKNSRVAAEIHTYLGHDLRLGAFDILGSGARAIVVDRKFGKYLEKKNLVTVDQVPYGYYFSRPWKTFELNKLGIRYLIVTKDNGKSLKAQNWKHLITTNNLSLFENPNKPSIIYTSKKNKLKFIESFSIKSNKIEVKLNDINTNSKLVFTFTKRAGYYAYIDGKPANIVEESNGFMSVNIIPRDKSVVLWHKPYNLFEIMFYVIGSILIVFFIARRLKKYDLNINN